MLRVLFSPRVIGLHLLALVVTGAAVWLGIWQYGSWQAHRQNQVLERTHAPAKPIQKVMSNDAPFPPSAVGQPVELRGLWVPQSTFYVSGKQMHGRGGYWAVTPVAVCGDHCTGRGAQAPAMLVVRGWTPSVKQAPAPPTGPVDVKGWLQPGEGSGFPDPNPADRVLPELRIADAIQWVNQDLYGAYVMSDQHEPGLTRLTPAALPKPDTSTALRNILYAIQWWAFGGFALYVWWRSLQDELAAARRPDEDGGGDSEDIDDDDGDDGTGGGNADGPDPSRIDRAGSASGAEVPSSA